jgi:hypothetical protein
MFPINSKAIIKGAVTSNNAHTARRYIKGKVNIACTMYVFIKIKVIHFER